MPLNGSNSLISPSNMIGVAIKMQFKGIRMQFNTRRNGEGRNANIIYNPWKNLLNILTNYGPLIFFAEKGI